MLPLDISDDGEEVKRETPLPWRQFGILLLLNLAEPISATIIYPFIAQLVDELGVAQDKSSIGYYVGIVESLFFLTEAIFVLQWGRLSDRIGRKPVLVIGLLGLAFSMTSFGLSHSLWSIIGSRALAGALNGNVGVLKSAIGELTDESNMARAFSFISLVWFVGSTAAPLVGGYFSHPAEAFPSFSHSFWRSNPYFLPCGMAAAFSLTCCIVALLFLRETKARARGKRHRPYFHSAESELTLFSPRDDYVEAAPFASADDPKSSPPSKESLSIRSLLIRPVLLAVLNYGLLAFLEISFQALLPIFLASSVHLTPSSIGLVLGTMGLVNGAIQLSLFVPLHRWLGSRNILTLGISSFGVIFAAFPFIARFHNENGGVLGFKGCALLALQMALCPIENMAFNVIFLYVQASSPSKSTLGATNGIAQTAASIARAIGPASATSLFAFSIQRQDVAGGALVYWILGAVTVFAAGVTRMLPVEPWYRPVEKESTFH